MNSATAPVSGADWTSHLSVPCTRVGACFPGIPMLLLPPLLAPSLQSLGQFIYSSEGGAEGGAERVRNLSQGPGNQSELLWGIPGAQTQDPSWKKNFPKGPFGHKCCDCIFLGSGAWSRVCLPEAFSVYPSFSHPPYPSRDWEKNLQKEPGLMETSFF